MEISGYKPFRKYSFYLDLRNCPQILNQLSQHINALGGRIEEFLNKNVKYIVTNRPKNVWPNKESVISSNNKLLLNRESDQSIHSPITKNNSFSRGKLLLSKLETDQKLVTNIPHVPKKTQTTDVLELGRIWNIKIIQALDMLEFCKKHLSPTVRSSPTKSEQITELRSPFIKVEDNNFKHRPNYKEFYDWPQINYEFHNDLCPFIKKKIHKSIQSTQSLEGLAFANQFNDKFGNNLNDHNKDKTSAKTQTVVKKKLPNKRRIAYYCEICSTEYEDITKHLKSDVHERFTENQENYKELLSVISSLPRFNEGHSSGKCMQFEDGSGSDGSGSDESDSDGSESSESHHEPCSPFQSTPNMSTTIQLCGSKHKSHFLPIHDLIGNNNRSQECQSDRSSSSGVDFIPPSVSSMRISQSKRNTFIHDSNLDHKSDDSSSYEESEEYFIVNDCQI